VDRL